MTPGDRPTSSSPRSGDLVRATADSRDATVVEGILHIRHVPALDYAQVNVIVDNRALAVVPESIEVLRPEEVSAEQLDAGDPLVDEPGWRRFTNLDEAAQAGLLHATRPREGGTWDDLFDQLAQRAQPMLDAGWTLVSTDREESWEYGDSVFWDLERGGHTVELEYYEHRQLVAYPVSDDHDDEEPTPAYFSIPDSTLETSRTAFEEQGWL